MKLLPLIALLLFSTAAFAAGPQRSIAFARDDNTVWIANLDGSGAKRVAAGVDPVISPDGTRVAYNTESASGPERRIVVMDLATGERTTFANVPSDNAFGPIWSPNGTKVLFYI